MKKLFFVTLLLVFSIAIYAQQDVTQFLGIPVDGSKTEMIRKLKTKGFRNDSYVEDCLVGKFNGIDVNVYIVTNNNKVCRIMVCDANSIDERSIQIRFNKLCEQFNNNPKYISLSEDQTIPEEEDISYEIAINKKRYEAVFYQQPTTDSITIKKDVKTFLSSKYTEEQLKNPTKEIEFDTFKYIAEKYYLPKSVWFMISSHTGKYYISMYYDNEYNQANGEDL